MGQFIATVSLIVPDYDEAIAFYTDQLGFDLVEDTVLSEDKRWVLIAPSGARGCQLLLAKASTADQRAAIGNQTGGRVFLFLETDHFDRDYQHMVERNVRFLEAPRDEAYGRVAVFIDPFGNKWDLIQKKGEA